MKTALITGGAKGIGLAVAEKLKNAGYNVVISYHSSAEKAKALQDKGFYTVYADVSNASDVKKMFGEIERRFPRLDVLINNAGVALKQKLFLDVSAEEFDDVFNVDVKGVFLCTKEAVGYMLKTGGTGDVISVSSIWGGEGASCEVVYSAAKGAVNIFTRALSKELAETDICVQAIAPALVETDMNAHLSEDDKKAFLNERGLKVPLYPEDVADAVLKLLQTRKNGAVTVIEAKDKIYEI